MQAEPGRLERPRTSERCGSYAESKGDGEPSGVCHDSAWLGRPPVALLLCLRIPSGSFSLFCWKMFSHQLLLRHVCHSLQQI